MKTIILKIVVIMLLVGGLTSCTRTDCPGFPEHLVDYFPYKKGDVLTFVNQNNDTVFFWVREVHCSQEFTLPPGNKCNDCCGATIFSFTAHRLLSKTLGEELGVVYDAEAGGSLTAALGAEMNAACDCDMIKNNKIMFRIEDSYWDHDYDTSTGMVELFEEIEKDPFDPQNTALFGETVILENGESPVSRVMIAKGTGITGFYDQKYDFQWTNIKI